MSLNNRGFIRFLSGLSFLIFFCPFFQTCSDKVILELPKIKEEKSIKIKNQLIDESKKIYTYNGYQLAYVFIDKTFFDKEDSIIDLTDLKDSLISISFLILIIISIAIFYFSIFQKEKDLTYVSILNLLIFIISTLLIMFERNFENINQIKIGYYLFLLNSILIIYFCRKELKSHQ